MPPFLTLRFRVSMLEADKVADYFFTSSHEPVHFVVHKVWMKMWFRFFCAEVTSRRGHVALGPTLQYLVKGFGWLTGA
ncbi:hypothetical protein BV22DRAFT_1032609, partial [Leucogyrophana mollusca]